MNEDTIIEQREELVKNFGIKIRREVIKQDEDLGRVVGGLCLLDRRTIGCPSNCRARPKK